MTVSPMLTASATCWIQVRRSTWFAAQSMGVTAVSAVTPAPAPVRTSSDISGPSRLFCGCPHVHTGRTTDAVWCAFPRLRHSKKDCEDQNPGQKHPLRFAHHTANSRHRGPHGQCGANTSPIAKLNGQFSTRRTPSRRG